MASPEGTGQRVGCAEDSANHALANSQQHRQSACHFKQCGSVNVANDPADLGSQHRLRPGNHDLRPLLQSTVLTGLDHDTCQRQVPQGTGERQQDDGREDGKVIGLNHQCRTWFACIALQSDSYQIPSAHDQSGNCHASAARASQNASSSRPRLLFAHLASCLDWCAASAAKPGAPVSGTQIWTGRKPACRCLSRVSRTR
jgi:hypothetical protein